MPEPIVATLLAIAAKSVGPLGMVYRLAQGNRQKRLEKWIGELDRNVRQAHAKCDAETFATLLERCVLSAAVDSREFRLALFKAILVDAFQDANAGAEAAMFVSIIDKIDTQHIHVLRLLSTTIGLDTGPEGDKPPAIGFSHIDEHLRLVCTSDSSSATDITTACVSDLIGFGLIHTRLRADSMRKMLVAISPVGLIRMQVFMLSGLGKSFVHFIENADQEAAESGASPL